MAGYKCGKTAPHLPASRPAMARLADLGTFPSPHREPMSSAFPLLEIGRFPFSPVGDIMLPCFGINMQSTLLQLVHHFMSSSSMWDVKGKFGAEKNYPQNLVQLWRKFCCQASKTCA